MSVKNDRHNKKLFKIDKTLAYAKTETENLEVRNLFSYIRHLDSKRHRIFFLIVVPD